MATLDELIVRIEADVSDLKRGLKQAEGAANRSGKKMSKSFAGLNASLKRVGKGVFSLKGALAGLGLGLGLRKVIQNTIRQEQALKAVDAAIKNTGGSAGVTTEQLAAMAAEFQRNTRFGDEFVLEISRQLIAFRNISSDVFEDTVDVILDFADATGRSAVGAVKTLGLAINDPLAGLGRLSQAGVALTKSQKELIKTLVESGDLLGAQRLLIEELRKSYGGAAVAARATLGGALDSLSNAFGDLFENAENTDQLTVALEELTQAISDPEFQKGAAELTSNVLAMGAAMASGIGAIAGFKQSLRDLFEIAPSGSQEKFQKQMRQIAEDLTLGAPSLPIPPAPSVVGPDAGPAAGLTDTQKILESLGDQNAELQTQLDLVGRSNSELEVGLAMLELRRALTGDELKQAEDLVIENAALTAEIGNQTRAIDKGRAARDAAESAGAAIGDEIDELRLRIQFAGEETEELRVQLRLIALKADLGADAAAGMEDEVRAAEALRTTLDGIVDAREAEANATSMLADVVDRLGFSFQSAFEDAIIGGKGLQEILAALEDDILRIGLRTLFTEPLFGGIAAGIKGETLPGEGIGGLVSGGISSGVDAVGGFFGGEEDAGMAELAEAATVATAGLDAAAAGGQAAGGVLGTQLVGQAAEAAVNTATLGVAETVASTAMGELAASALAASIALQAVAASGAASSSMGALADATIAANPAIFHGGGTVGSTGVPSRSVSAGIFAGAQRFHDGLPNLRANEIPAILEKGEQVIPRGQGGGGDTFMFTINGVTDGAGVQASVGQIRGSLVEAVQIGRRRNG